MTSISSLSVVTAAGPICATPGRRDLFLRILEQVRQQYELVVLGYVVMPEHVHLLVSEPRKRNLSVALKALKQGVARRLLGSARRKKQDASQLALFPPDELPQRFWQRRFYDFNVFTEKKRIEKLRYMHRNPVKRGLVEKPEDWRWSSFRQYAFGEKGLVEINAVFPPNWAFRRDENPHKQNRLVWGTPNRLRSSGAGCVGHPPNRLRWSGSGVMWTTP